LLKWNSHCPSTISNTLYLTYLISNCTLQTVSTKYGLTTHRLKYRTEHQKLSTASRSDDMRGAFLLCIPIANLSCHQALLFSHFPARRWLYQMIRWVSHTTGNLLFLDVRMGPRSATARAAICRVVKLVVMLMKGRWQIERLSSLNLFGSSVEVNVGPCHNNSQNGTLITVRRYEDSCLACGRRQQLFRKKGVRQIG
jgi:hypothetical protein